MYNKRALNVDLGKFTKPDPYKDDILYTEQGQWQFPGQPTRIPSNDITMEGVPYPVYGIDNTGYEQMMYPGEDYTFPGDYVDEYPMARRGGYMQSLPKKKSSKRYSRSLTATNKLFTKNPLTKNTRSKKNRVFDPNAKYYQEGGAPYNYNPFVSNEPEEQETPMPFNPIRTENDPEDYNQFLEYSKTAPENRRPYSFYGDPNEYDHYGMWEALGKPGNFEKALQMNSDWQPDPYDGYYHGFSVNPNTGVFLKSGKPGFKEGDTTWMEIAGHYLSPRANESTPVYDPDLQRFKYVPNKQKGGFNDDINKRRQVLRDWTYGKSIGMLQEPDGGYIELDLSDAEIDQYRKGGYIVEDISIPTLTKAEYGMPMGTGMSQNYMGNTRTFYQTGGKTVPKFQSGSEKDKKKLITYKTDAKLIDGTAAFDLISKVPISADYNQQIKDRLYSGKWGFDPNTGALVKLNKSQQATIPTNIKNIRQEEKEDQEYRQAIARGEIKPRIDTPIQQPANQQMTKQEVEDFVRQGYDAAILNPAFQTAAYFTPPGMAIGAIQGAANLIPDLYAGDYEYAALDAASILPFAKPIANTVKSAVKNTYKINPLALKENPEMFLYRARPIGQNPDINMAAQLRAKEAAGEPLKWWQKNLLKRQTSPEMLAREKYFGQWFEKDPSRLDFYIDPGTRNFADNDAIEILRTKLPKSEANKLNVSQFDDAKILSASPETEFILPKDMVNSAERFPESSWQQLIQEDKAFNTPHWLKGYKEVPKPQFDFTNNQVLTQQTRLLNPKIKEKFFTHQNVIPENISTDNSFNFKRGFADELNRITPENYENFIQNIHGTTGYIPSALASKNPGNLGVGSYGTSGKVFSDSPLNKLQKDIINAHEKNHGVFAGTLSREMSDDLLKPFGGRGVAAVKGYKARLQPDEVLARMAQFKNALGFKGNEIFTKEHLNLIRQNYAKDFIDNSITDMLSKIKVNSKNEKQFIKNMNKYAFGLAPATIIGAGAMQEKKYGGEQYALGGAASPKDLNPATMQKYKQDLRLQENSIKAGYNKAQDRWYPHASVEGGNKTIGYGHKLTNAEVDKFNRGITSGQVEELLTSDILKHQAIAENMIDKKYGKGAFDKLPQAAQMIFVDYAYNGVLGQFPTFTDALVKRNKNLMLKEYERSSSGGKLTERNNWTRGIIEKNFQDGGPIELELTPEEIDWYISQGYEVEDLN
jgi:hypothetical protein